MRNFHFCLQLKLTTETPVSTNCLFRGVKLNAPTDILVVGQVSIPVRFVNEIGVVKLTEC